MNAVSFWWLLVVVIKIICFVNANWITGNLCWSMPCMNGGSCFGSAYTYICICPINYSGALCEKRLGICQKNPCGNRGLCIEKGLTSFECRCYFNYMGPKCEEHVLKTGPHIWSSLLPTHTRLLFDMLQEAYREKTKGKSLISSNNGQIDFIDLLSSAADSLPMTSTTTKSTFITYPIEITEKENIIQGENIQLDKIFPDISTTSIKDMNTNQFTEQSSQFDDPTTSEIDITSTTMFIENITITATEQIQPDFFNTTEDQEILNTTEQSNIIITSTSLQSSNDNNIINDITTQNLFEETNNNAESIDTTNTEPIDITSSTIDITNDDDDKFYSLDQTITSTINTSEQPLSTSDTTTITQPIYSQLLYNLCQQILSRLLPNAPSSVVAEAALSLASNSSLSINNNTADVLVSWVKKYLNSTTTTTATSIVPSLLINEEQTSSMPLQRINMDDALHQMNNNIDGEH